MPHFELFIFKHRIYFFALGTAVKEHLVLLRVGLSYLFEYVIVGRGKHHPCRLGAGQADTHLADACEVVKPRVLTANVAKAVLALVQDDFAKTSPIKVGASFPIAKLEMRGVIV